MKVMSVIGILVSAIGLFFALSFMTGGATDTEVGIGFITLILFAFTLAQSIVGVAHKCKPVEKAEKAE
ncbi:MAG: hypothetical protein WC773_02395 [Patescibacteria group bacterium]|jgi:hypothetical protein